MSLLKISTSFFVLVVMNAMIDFCLAEDSPKDGPKRHRRSLCGFFASYDPKNEICCDGKVYPKSSKDSCCGKTPYKRKGSFLACCRKYFYTLPKIYDTRLKICCGGDLKPNMVNGCCGSTVYNTQSEICCGGKIHKKKATQFCCGKTVYNAQLKICCAGKLHSKTSNSACCGKAVFDTRLKICCRGKLHSKGKNLSCCGSSVLDTRYKICCAGRVQPIGSSNPCCGPAASLSASIQGLLC